MKYHSQNQEAETVINYFKGKTGTLLDIGANDGKTFSNSYDLIQLGWRAFLLEPSTVCAELLQLHKGNPKVDVYNYGIGLKNERVKFYESGAHVKNGTDKALVSSSVYEETERWRIAGVQFKEIEVELVTFKNLFKELHRQFYFNFISIDCEGNDWNVLQQINLKQVGCECLCIEWNGVVDLQKLYSEYCGRFGLKEIYRSAENLIFAV